MFVSASLYLRAPVVIVVMQQIAMGFECQLAPLDLPSAPLSSLHTAYQKRHFFPKGPVSQQHLGSNSLSIFRLLSACHVPATALGTVPRLSPSSVSPLRSVLFTPIVLSCVFRNIREFPRGDMAHEHPVLAPEGLTVQWWGWGREGGHVVQHCQS